MRGKKSLAFFDVLRYTLLVSVCVCIQNREEAEGCRHRQSRVISVDQARKSGGEPHSPRVSIKMGTHGSV